VYIEPSAEGLQPLWKATQSSLVVRDPRRGRTLKPTMATTTTGRVAVPVVLVENSQCKKILEVRTDGTSTLSGFQRQLAVGLFTAGKLLEDLKYRGNSVSGDSRLDNFASGSSQDPRFTASCSTLPSGDRDTHQMVFVKTSSGRVLTQVHQ